MARKPKTGDFIHKSLIPDEKTHLRILATATDQVKAYGRWEDASGGDGLVYSGQNYWVWGTNRMNPNPITLDTILEPERIPAGETVEYKTILNSPWSSGHLIGYRKNGVAIVESHPTAVIGVYKIRRPQPYEQKAAELLERHNIPQDKANIAHTSLLIQLGLLKE
jgi:hypothetical protein